MNGEIFSKFIGDSRVKYFHIFSYMLKGKTTIEIMENVDNLSQDEIWEAIQKVADSWDEFVQYGKNLETIKNRMEADFRKSDLYKRLHKANWRTKAND